MTALGGPENVLEVEPVAQTRVRVRVQTTRSSTHGALARAGLLATLQIESRACVAPRRRARRRDQYAEAMKRRLVTPSPPDRPRIPQSRARPASTQSEQRMVRADIWRG